MTCTNDIYSHLVSPNYISSYPLLGLNGRLFAHRLVSLHNHLVQQLALGVKILAEPMDVIDLLLHGEIRILGQANAYEFHEMAHRTASRTPAVQVAIEEYVLGETDGRLGVQSLFVVDGELPQFALIRPQGHLLKVIRRWMGDGQIELALLQSAPGGKNIGRWRSVD